MKKTIRRIETILLSLALALTLGATPLAAWNTAYADSIEEVTVVNGSTASDWLPHRTGFKYSRSQIIYDAADIGRDGVIVSLAYDVASESPGYRISNMKIWMGYTDLDRYDYNSSGWAATSGYTLREPDITPVYNGRPDIGTKTGWQIIELDEPFEYDHNNGNLVIVTSVSASDMGEGTLEYNGTVYGNGFKQDQIVAIEVDDDQDPTVTSPDAYTGNNAWRTRSARPNIRLWFDTSEGGQVADCEVSFDADGGSPAPETQTISRGGRATQPEDPVKEGYRFTGWYKGDNTYNFDSRVNMSFTLKAGWVKVHNIKFIGWNNEELQSSVVDEGQKPEYEGETPARPAEGDKEYLFAGWDPAVAEAHADQTYTAVFVDKDDLADKAALNEAISKSTDARTGVRTSSDGRDVGKNFEYVSAEQWQAYDGALNAAQAVADDPFASQEAVDQAISDLAAAKETFLAAKQQGSKNPPAITEIVISRNSGRQQPAAGGSYEWKVTFAEGTDLKKLPEGAITDDDFQIQRKPSGQEWKNSKCPYVSFSPSDAESETNIGYLTGMAIPDNTKETDTTNLWRFIYSGDFAEGVECPVITQDGYSHVDKAALKAAISDAQDAQKDIKVSKDGWDVDPSELFVTPEEKQAHDDAIEAAQAVDANDRASQAQVDAAVTDLQKATADFIAAKKGGNGEDEPDGYSDGDYRLVYETQKIALPDIPVRVFDDADDTEADWFTEKPLAFEFYDSTTQESAGVFTTDEGTYSGEDGAEHQTQLLSGVELVRGHKYIVSVNEPDYMIPAYYTVTIADDGAGNSSTYTANMVNYYISLKEEGAQPKDIKNDADLKYFDVMKRASDLDDVTDGRRVNVRIPVYYTQDGSSSTIFSVVSGAIIRLTSPVETLYATSNGSGEISVALIEDLNYMVELVDDSGALGLSPFPLTVKDHAENGWPKSIYNHFSCGSVQGLYLVDKQYEHANDTKLVSISGKTSVTGQNFQNTSETNEDRYFINDRQLDNSMVSGLDGWDYEVFMVEAVNMFRTEISRLAAGGFEITRTLPAGRDVERVYYINKSGKLKSLAFTQAGGKVTYSMKTLSMYPNVIVYKTSAPAASQTTPQAAAQSASVSSGTVNAAAVKAAIAAAGGDSVTEFEIGKNVKKISKGAFAGTNVKTLVVKSKKLRKKSVKGSLKGSAVTTVKVKVGKTKTNKKYVKKYKKIFTKKNAGKKVKVKR